MADAVRQDPAWTRDELIVMCEALRKRGWVAIRKHESVATELSTLLRQMDVHPLDRRTEKFRSPSSVQRKCYDLLTHRDEYLGKGTRGGRLDLEVLQEFEQNPSYMEQVAAAVTVAVQEVPSGGEVLWPDPFSDDDSWERPEGAILLRKHRVFERDRNLRKKKIAQAMEAQGRLACEACTFDFKRVYGELGDGFIHVHHLTPLHVSGPRNSILSDLALLCANCHAMAHRSREWPSVEDLREVLAAQR